MERMNIERIFARLLVVLGGLFWVAMIWGAQSAYVGAPFTLVAAYSGLTALMVAAVFVVSLFYERAAALLLLAGVVGLLVAGLVVGWEAGVWATVFFVLMLPMLVSAALYWAAARMQKICELSPAM
jgi:hypothetical protein